MDRITIRAPTHLHVGNFDLSGDMGRLFGTVGFSIEKPRLEIEARKADGTSANNDDARFFARRFTRELDLPGADIVVNQAPPKYVGVGYHTTLALSIGKALSCLYNLSLKLEEIALIMKRGLITALGLYACKSGGFIIEGGFRPEEIEEMVPPLLFRHEIPPNWFFVVAIPKRGRERIVNLRENEGEILENLRSMPKDMSAELSRLILVKMMPSLIEKNIEEFGEALTKFNSELGAVWSDYQEDRYCNKIVGEGVSIMKKRAFCACQSSWGPTFYGLTEGKSMAIELTEELTSFLERSGGGDVFYTGPKNEGLEVI